MSWPGPRALFHKSFLTTSQFERFALNTTWVATSYGALDISKLTSAAEAGIDCMVLPTRPSEPIGLKDHAGALWRRLVAGPVPDSDLSPEQRTMVREFEEHGLASTNPCHLTRKTTLAGSRAQLTSARAGLLTH